MEEARTEQALLGYEQSVLFALEEVEGTMVAYYQERVRRDRLVEAVVASERSVELVRTQDRADELGMSRPLLNLVG